MTSCTACASKVNKFLHTIVTQGENPTTDAGGGQSDPWASPITVATVRACIEPFGGSEALRAMQLEDTVTHRITIRYKAGIIAKQRIQFGTRLMNIRRVINVEERNRFLEILAEEGVAT